MNAATWVHFFEELTQQCGEGGALDELGKEELPSPGTKPGGLRTTYHSTPWNLKDLHSRDRFQPSGILAAGDYDADRLPEESPVPLFSQAL